MVPIAHIIRFSFKCTTESFVDQIMCQETWDDDELEMSGDRSVICIVQTCWKLDYSRNEVTAIVAVCEEKVTAHFFIFLSCKKLYELNLWKMLKHTLQTFHMLYIFSFFEIFVSIALLGWTGSLRLKGDCHIIIRKNTFRVVVEVKHCESVYSLLLVRLLQFR